MTVPSFVPKCIELAESERNVGERMLVILPQIAYIRQPEGIEYLNRYLDSDLRLPPTDPVEKGEPVARWVLDMLAGCIKDFPVEKKPGRSYAQDDVETARKWMADKSNWKIIR